MKTTRIYEDNAGQIFAVVMSNGDTVKVVSGIERATDYTLGDIISDAIDGFERISNHKKIWRNLLTTSDIIRIALRILRSLNVTGARSN